MGRNTSNSFEEIWPLKSGVYKIISLDGETLIDTGFDEVKSINGDNIIIKKGSNYGVITSSKEVKIIFMDLN